MKKLLLSLLLVPFSLSCFSLPWFSKPQPQPYPKVLSIEVFDKIDVKKISGKLFEATKRPDVCGVILMVDSNGGDAGDFSVIHDMVKKLASVKPVVCLVAGAAYSGGYMVASAATTILVHSCSGIGSIGAQLSVDRYANTRIKEDRGVEADFKAEVFSAGEFKNLFNVYLPNLTESQRAFLQVSLMKSYKTFIKIVAANRGLNEEDYKIWAEGKTFEASEALELGLIDGIGTIFDAEAKIKELIVERNPNFGPVDAIKFIY